MTFATTHNGNTSTMEWETFNIIMRDRYEDGRKEIRTMILAALEKALDNADEANWLGLFQALAIAKDVKIEYPRTMDASVE